MKNIISSLFIAVLSLLVMPFTTLALDTDQPGDSHSKDQAVADYKLQLEFIGMESEDAEKKANSDAGSILKNIEAAQTDTKEAYEALETRIKNLSKNDSRKTTALSNLKRAEKRVNELLDLRPEKEFAVQPAVAGALPRIFPSSNFEEAQKASQSAMSDVNRTLIAPQRPGAVPEGDIVSDFIPQVVRQLFRFAWLGVLLSFIVSGVMLVMAQGNDEHISKAKTMIYYSLLGFAFIALAFAMVKGVTDIDFFRFI